MPLIDTMNTECLLHVSLKDSGLLKCDPYIYEGNMCLQSVRNHSPTLTKLQCHTQNIQNTQLHRYKKLKTCMYQSLCKPSHSVYYYTNHTYSVEHNTGLFGFNLCLTSVLHVSACTQHILRQVNTTNLIMKDIINNAIKSKEDPKM